MREGTCRAGDRPARKRRGHDDPFTGEERWFDAKPATVRIKARALKKLKDAAA
ncbi:histone family protein DNA-binding protein [Paraburkholderia terrae]|uniref:Histone family protein DNA-binding protein n=1 Tax=Paraburkholderia terrae TaxID=311230 RepID=A0A2I8F550_9BURK|nr:histone family protein DNA-binding protein [Paraburkholderia terrae]